MAIKITLQETESELFCASKWWGDPDMPADMQYPMIQATEDGETYEYPLTFICQINCEDIAPYDKEGRLPHEGMLYFFGNIDYFLGYDAPVQSGLGRWEKGMVAVKYAKHVNMETFESYVMLDDEDNPLTAKPLKITFSECEDTDDGIKLLGLPFFEEVRDENPDAVNLLQIDGIEGAGEQVLRFYDEGMLNILIKDSDLGFGNWKKAYGFLHSL